MNTQRGKIMEIGIQLNFEWKNQNIYDSQLQQYEIIPRIERQVNWCQPDSEAFKDDFKNIE